MQKHWRPYIALLIAVSAVGASSLFIRLAQNAGASSLVIAAWRLVLATLIVTPVALTRYRPQLRQMSRKQLMLPFIPGVMLAAHFALWISSLEYTSVITSVVLDVTNPIWVALATPFIIKEPLSRVTLYAIGVAMVGVLIVGLTGDAGNAPKQNAPFLGFILAELGAIAVSGYYIGGRMLRKDTPLIPYLWLMYGMGAITMLGVVAVAGEPVLGLSWQAYAFMTLLGIVSQLVGHSAYNFALGYLSAAYVTLANLGEPIVGTTLALLFLGEVPRPFQLIGGILIIGALWFASREEAKQTATMEITAEASTI